MVLSRSRAAHCLHGQLLVLSLHNTTTLRLKAHTTGIPIRENQSNFETIMSKWVLVLGGAYSVILLWIYVVLPALR